MLSQAFLVRVDFSLFALLSFVRSFFLLRLALLGRTCAPLISSHLGLDTVDVLAAAAPCRLAACCTFRREAHVSFFAFEKSE